MESPKPRRVVYTTAAIATLIEFDRFSVSAILMCIDTTFSDARELNVNTRRIDAQRKIYASHVLCGSVPVFWKYLEKEDVMEVIAIGIPIDTKADEIEKIAQKSFENLRVCG
ncbi:MAG: hypothetical protein KGI60_02195 [Patescibacteria group bacterium]|nr:hypothetical protein [Patescibacteria group bacterium]